MRQIVRFLFRWDILALISGNEDNPVSFRITVILHLRWFVLEELHVHKTVKKSVSGTTHDNFLWIIGRFSSINLGVLLGRVCLEVEVLDEVVFLSLDQLQIINFESRLVSFKTFDELVIFIFFLNFTSYTAENFEEDVEALSKEDDNRCGVVCWFQWVCMSHCFLDGMAR